MTDHPITPPPELVQEWAQIQPVHQAVADHWQHIATCAAQWGADQQLAEDAKWLDHNALNEPYLRITPVGESLKEAMRPNLPSLKEQALEELQQLSIDPEGGITYSVLDTIRRALEELPDN
jgi:hypothetical protein